MSQPKLPEPSLTATILPWVDNHTRREVVVHGEPGWELRLAGVKPSVIQQEPKANLRAYQRSRAKRRK